MLKCPVCLQVVPSPHTARFNHLMACGVITDYPGLGYPCCCGAEIGTLNGMVKHIRTVPHDWEAMAVVKILKEMP